MMIYSIREAITRLETITELSGKIVFDHFTTAQTLPFACYLYDFDTSGADDYKGIQWIDFKLELYAENRDIALESKIIKLFADLEIDSDSKYLSDERMYITVFNFRFPQKIA